MASAIVKTGESPGEFFVLDSGNGCGTVPKRAFADPLSQKHKACFIF